MMITGIIRLSQRQMLMRLFSLYGKPWLIGMSVVIAAMAIWSLAADDLRIMICALIVFFIVVPMVMAFLYINHSLSPDVAFNVLPHTVSLGENGVELTIYKSTGTQDEDKEDRPLDDHSQDSQVEEKDKRDEEVVSFSRVIPYGFFGKYTVGSDCVYISISDRGFMYLPLSAFKNGEEMQLFLNEMASRKVGR